MEPQILLTSICLLLRSKKNIRPRLCLIAHFIKKPWQHQRMAAPNSSHISRAIEPHFYQLREMLNKRAECLFQLLRAYPKLKNIITAIDCAGNELDTPPEVFGVLYRRCRREGIENFTYHAGEDFEHLLGGVRAIFDAMNFLGLGNGNRIGHATAIGLAPDTWLRRAPHAIYLSRGQWLENLLFLRLVAINNQNSCISLPHLEEKIAQITHEIFNEQVHTQLLGKFYLSRDLSPDIVKRYLVDPNCLYFGWRNEEYNRIKKEDYETLNLLKKRWFDPEVIARYECKQPYSLKEIPRDWLLEAQQYVQAEVAERQIVIETLPTSNVRIGHYDDISDHHIFRWIGVPTRTILGDHSMLVALGSDDPGIFATDMRNELYHLFSSLVCDHQYTVDDAFYQVVKINENGRVYSFKSTD